MRKPKIKTLKNKCDIVWSKSIRNRDGSCVYCQSTDKRLEAHHIISRNVLETRYNMDNGVTLCGGCHRQVHSRPLEFTEFIYKRLGKQRYWDLIKESHQKITPKHLDWYIEMFEKLKED